MLLLMPAWEESASGSGLAGRYIGVKTITVFPDNAARDKPAVLGTYLLMSTESGETLAVMDATRLTAWRTAAASALASRYLSRPDASRLLMVGAVRWRRSCARACLRAADPRGRRLEPHARPRRSGRRPAREGWHQGVVATM
jgi:ornithine cyclodeaminase